MKLKKACSKSHYNDAKKQKKTLGRRYEEVCP